MAKRPIKPSAENTSSKDDVDSTANNIEATQPPVVNDMDKNLAETTEKVQAATDKLSREVEKFVHQGIDTVQRLGREYVDKMNTQASHAGEHAKKAYSESEAYVRDNPVPSVLGAFAIGVLLGVLLRRD